MKTIKNSWLLQILLAFSVSLFAGCQEYVIESQPELQPVLEVSALEHYDVGALSADAVKFSISSSNPWHIETITEGEQGWCTVSPSMSSASSLIADISVSFSDNTGLEARTATLVISAEGIEQNRTVTITQASASDLRVIEGSGIVPSEGGIYEFQVISNKPWRIVPSIDYLTGITPDSGDGSTGVEPVTVKVKVLKNELLERQADIKVITTFQEKTLTVTQEGGLVLEPGVALPEGAFAFAAGVKEQLLPIASNIDWKAEVPEEYASWISAVRAGDDLKVTMLKGNERFAARSAVVRLVLVKPIAGFQPTEIKITQDPDPKFKYSAEEGHAITEDGSLKVSADVSLVSLQKITKGHITLNFKELKIVGDTKLHVIVNNENDGGGLGNFKMIIGAKATVLRIGGEYTFFKKQDIAIDASTIKKVEFVIVDDPLHEGFLQMSMLINGELVWDLHDRTVPSSYEGENPGLDFCLQFAAYAGGTAYTMESYSYVKQEL